MLQFQNTYLSGTPTQTMNDRPSADWSSEITPLPAGQRMPESGGLDLKSGLAPEVIEAPTTVDEAYKGSMKAMLARNVGNYIVATFLIGTQGTAVWEGILYDVGNDYIIIYQAPRDRYIVGDLYALKYMEFYDPRQMNCGTAQQAPWQGAR